jgi:hypothetical protein
MHTYEKNIRFTQSKSTQVKLGIRLVCMSDLHHIPHDFPVPDGDVLIIAGDVCGYGTRKELEIFDDFLSRQGHAYKLLIAGNHDWPYARLPLEEAKGLVKNAVYLQDTGVEICGLKFWGSPWQPWFLDWAFNMPRGPQLAEIWAKIPDDIDVLITHTPPYGILDQLISGKHVGCADLANAWRESGLNSMSSVTSMKGMGVLNGMAQFTLMPLSATSIIGLSIGRLWLTYRLAKKKFAFFSHNHDN